VPFLDTTVLIDLMRTRNPSRRAAALDAMARLTTPTNLLTTSRFNVAECLVGVARSADPANEQRKLDANLVGVSVREFDDDAMRAYVRIAKRQAGLGRPVGVMDMFIASVAVVAGQPLLTRNPRHFRDVAGLTVVAYG
jgi:predicted nucleic acid-binding protein